MKPSSRGLRAPQGTHLGSSRPWADETRLLVDPGTKACEDCSPTAGIRQRSTWPVALSKIDLQCLVDLHFPWSDSKATLRSDSGTWQAERSSTLSLPPLELARCGLDSDLGHCSEQIASIGSECHGSERGCRMDSVDTAKDSSFVSSAGVTTVRNDRCLLQPTSNRRRRP